ncbi:MAG: D-alanyl-D-alanine carboxypeptidase/D-alanyl-D-alanine-endopeptidase [Geobacter sp.]|nr:D-alanyl-D-alanine carboxypeptidase/D-alanyl-D-alanine-endopeptidase [Geobacter sp.]
MQTGKELASAGTAIKEPLVPASLVKLFTAGAVLDHRDRRGTLDLMTTILHDGEIKNGTLHGNIYLRGRGNAFLSESDLKEAARKIVGMGIRKITGSVVADDAFFDTKGLERTRKGAGHAPAGALGLDLHTVAVTVTPTEPGKPPMVMVEPPNDAVRLAVEGRTTATGVGNVKVMQIDDASYRVSGNIAAGSAPMKWRFALHDPARYASGVLNSELKRLGVVVEGKVREGRTPDSAQILAGIDAPPLETVLRDMNVNSLNVVADNLLLLLGAEKYGAPGTREKGLGVVNEFLETLGLSEGEGAIVDGSGLLEGNRVTSGYLAHYLHKVSQKPWFSMFRDSLPRAGIDGTLRDIGYRDERFRAKTGRLENAFALAGYGVDGKGRGTAFAFIVNMPGASAVNLERSGAEVMRYLAENQ